MAYNGLDDWEEAPVEMTFVYKGEEYLLCVGRVSIDISCPYVRVLNSTGEYIIFGRWLGRPDEKEGGTGNLDDSWITSRHDAEFLDLCRSYAQRLLRLKAFA